MRKALVWIYLVFISSSCFTQNSSLGNWTIYFGNQQLSNRWNLHYELQYRNYNAFTDLEQLLIRSGVGYNLSEENNNVLLGYGYILSQNYLDSTRC